MTSFSLGKRFIDHKMLRRKNSPPVTGGFLLDKRMSKKDYIYKNIDAIKVDDFISCNGVWCRITRIVKENHHPIMLYNIYVENFKPPLRMAAGLQVKIRNQ